MRTIFAIALVMLLGSCAPGTNRESSGATELSNSAVHLVQPGDTILSISSKYGVNIGVLRKTNHLTNDKVIPGQILFIPGRKAHEGPPVGYVEEGVASWYGQRFHGKRTASGERFDMYAFTAAHRTLPFGSIVRVVRTDTGGSVYVRINDRGPFVKKRILDLSYAAARQLGIIHSGTAPIHIEVIDYAR